MEEKGKSLQSVLMALNNRPEIRLSNIYKGLPISNEATVTAVESASVVVRSNRYQLVCMYLNRETFIHSLDLPSILNAKVLQLKPSSMEARLGNFQFVKQGVGARQQVRVEPLDSMNSLIQPKAANHPIRAELSDISMNGLGIYLQRQYFVPEVYRPGVEIKICLTLPDASRGLVTPTSSQPSDGQTEANPFNRFSRDKIRGNPVASGGHTELSRLGPKDGGYPIPTEITLRAVIKNIKPEMYNNRIRLGLRTFAGVAEQSAIANFISQRQTEIIREVRDLHGLLFKFE